MQQHWIYEPRLENYEVKGLIGDYQVSDERIARVIATGKEAFNIIQRECGESPEKRLQYLKEATRRHITVEEQKGRDGIPLRRCPSCLAPTPSIMVYCLACKAEFWCRPISSSSFTPHDEPPTYRVPPASSSSSSPPTVVPALPELLLPEVPGVEGKIDKYRGYSYVRPEKRSVTPFDGTGKQGTPGFFEYCGVRASGTYVTLNNTFVSNIGISVLRTMKEQWPEKHVPNIDIFMKFLRGRTIGDNKSMADLFAAPVASPGNWVQIRVESLQSQGIIINYRKRTMARLQFQLGDSLARNKIGDTLQNCDRWPTK